MILHKLGKLPASHDPRNLMFADYINPAVLPAAPVHTDYGCKVIQPWGMMLNDHLGCCTIAGIGHKIMNWTANAGHQYNPLDSEILNAYVANSNYNPQTRANDSGCIMTKVLNYMRYVGISGHKVGAYASILPQNTDHAKIGLYLFGSLYLGFELPISVQGHSEWSGAVTSDPNTARGSWGGHAVCAVGYDEVGVTIITWGQPLKVTWEFFNNYCDEAYAVWSEDFISGDQRAPNGFNQSQLLTDLASIS